MKETPRSLQALARDVARKHLTRRLSLSVLSRRWFQVGMAVVVLAGLVFAVTPLVVHADAVTTPDTALDTMWNTYGNQGGHWTGGDETVSIALPDGRIAWLFSDTFLGKVNSDHSRPANTPLIHNSLVVQQGSSLTTITGGTPANPTSLVGAATDGNPNDAGHWVDDAFIYNNQLYVFYTHYLSTGSSSLAVKQVDTSIAAFSLPDLSLQGVTELNVGASIKWGTAILDQPNYTYIYGAKGATVGQTFQTNLYLARAPHGQVLTAGSNPTAAWQFWTGSSWSTSESAAAAMMSGVGSGFSVKKIGSQFVLVTQDTDVLFSPNIVAYTATSPTGPFGNQTYLYATPETQGNIITYDPRIHTELGGASTLVVSYNVDSLQSSDNYADVRIYRPRFIDVTWPVAPPNPATQPDAPTNLTASSDNQGIHLSWKASATSGVSYWVYLQDLTAGWTQPSRLPTPVTSGTSLTLGELTNNDTYQFYVTAFDSGGESPPSNSVTAVFTIPAPTKAPTGLSATANSDGTISLQWNAVSGPGITYNVYQQDDTAGETSFTRIDSFIAHTSYTVQNLTQDHQYEFKVSASNAGGEGPLSAPVTATSHAQPPAAPTNLTATANNDSSISLNWTAPAPGLWYWVYWKDVTANQNKYTRSEYPITSGDTTFTVTYLTVGDTYSFYVTALNVGGESNPSNIVQATVYQTPPSAPTGLTATANSDGSITLNWSAPGPDVYYWVYWRDKSNGQTAYTKSTYPVTNGTSFTATYLNVGDTYQFYATATNAGGESPPSNTVKAVSYMPPPPAPTSLEAAAGNGQVALSWAAPGPGLWYWVYWKDVTANQTSYTRSQDPVSSGTSFTVTYLTNGDTYSFYVTATNAGGESSPSNVVQATPNTAPPGAPTDLSATAGNGQIGLSWTAPGPGLYYWVYWRDTTARQTSYTRSQYPVSSGTTFTITYLNNGDTYECYVTAVNSGGESPPSNHVLATPLPPLPPAPTGLTATSNDDGSITLNWSAPASGLWYWVYWRDTTAGQTTYTRSRDPVSSGTSFTATYLTQDDLYEFYVTAINAAGESPASNTAAAYSNMLPPPAPTNLTGQAEDGWVNLNWKAPASGLWYWVYWKDVTAGQTTYKRFQYPVTSGTNFAALYLFNSHTYDFYVTALNAGGESPRSNIVSVFLPIPDGTVSAAVTSNWVNESQNPFTPFQQLFDVNLHVTGQRTNGTTITVTYSWSDTAHPPFGPPVRDAAFGYGLFDCTTGQREFLLTDQRWYPGPSYSTSGTATATFTGKDTDYYTATAIGFGTIWVPFNYDGAIVRYPSEFSYGTLEPPNQNIIPLSVGTPCF